MDNKEKKNDSAEDVEVNKTDGPVSDTETDAEPTETENHTDESVVTDGENDDVSEDAVTEEVSDENSDEKSDEGEADGETEYADDKTDEKSDGYLDDLVADLESEKDAETGKSEIAPVKKTWRERSNLERAITVIPAILMLILVIVTRAQMEVGQEYPLEFKLSFALVCVSVIIGIFCIRLGKVWGWIVTALTPAASFFLTEFMIRNPFMEGKGLNSPGLFAMNLIIFYGFAMLILFVTGSMKASVVLTAVVPMLYTIANYYVWEFRDSPLFPWVIASAGTAAGVVDNYKFVVTWHVCFIVCAFLFIILLGFLCTPRIRLNMLWLRIPVSIIAALSIVLTCSYVQSDEGVKKLKMYPYLFTPNYVYWKNGAAVSLAYTSRFMSLEKPQGYSIDSVNEIIAEYQSDPVDENQKLPNVIVIMNEAFSDLKTAVDYNEKFPVTPYIDSMVEDTVKGTAHVSVKGGDTANSEFEFLTGMTMANVNPGSIPYQQFLRGETPNFASQLKELGYSAYGMHPYGASGWNRKNVYEWFGFERSFFSAHFNTYKEKYNKIRGYYSDEATYKKIIELNETKPDGKPFFVFNVTMQNHGGYTGINKFPEFKLDKVYAEGTTINGVTNVYLTLINKSDEAFGNLIEYFKKQDEPTIILMFGDHQPNDNVVTPLWKKYGGAAVNGSLDEQLRRYTVPFVMWANYDIEEETNVDTSLNYLSTLLCEKAGIPKTGFQNYLSDLSESYPVIAAGHYSDAEGNYYDASTFGQIDAMKDYAKLSYNLIADRKNTVKSFFSYN